MQDMELRVFGFAFVMVGRLIGECILGRKGTSASPSSHPELSLMTTRARHAWGFHHKVALPYLTTSCSMFQHRNQRQWQTHERVVYVCAGSD